MWPRLFSQLVELLPHATRLLPMADNYLAVRREGAQSQSQAQSQAQAEAQAAAQAAAIAELAESMRADAGQIVNSYNSLARQVAEQKSQLAVLQDAVEVTQAQSVAQTRQLEWITTDLNSLRVWVKFGTVTIVLLLAAVLALTVQILRGR
jgi:chromosome segregation ATPase